MKSNTNQWFIDNAMQLNGDKYKLMMISAKPNNVEKCSIYVSRQIVKEESKVKLLGVIINTSFFLNKQLLVLTQLLGISFFEGK